MPPIFAFRHRRAAGAFVAALALAGCAGSSEDGDDGSTVATPAAAEPTSPTPLADDPATSPPGAGTREPPVDTLPEADPGTPSDASDPTDDPTTDPAPSDPEADPAGPPPDPEPPERDDPAPPEAEPPAPVGAPTDAQGAAIGADCLVAPGADGTAYGYCPATRTLSAVRPDGTVFWSFALPGEAATNRVDALAVTGDAGAPLVLVARTVDADGAIAHEISRFEAGGAFVDTLPILAPLPGPAPYLPPAPRDANLDDEPLLAVADGARLLVAGTRYATLEGGDPNQRSDRVAAGGFLASVEARDGATRAYRAFDGAAVTAIGIASPGTVEVALARADGATDARTGRYAVDTLLASGAGPALPALAPDTVATALPAMVEAQRLGRVEDLGARIDRLIALLGADVVATAPACAPDAGRCPYDVVADPVTLDCPAGGSATATASASADFTAGVGRYATSGTRWSFAGCALEVAGTEGLPDGRHALDGGYSVGTEAGGVRRGEREIRRFALDALVLARPDGSRESATAAHERVSGRNYGIAPTSFERTLATVERYDDGRVRVGDARLELDVEHRFTPSRGEPDTTTLAGGLTRAAPDTGGRALRLDVVPALVAVAPRANAPDGTLEGALTLASDAASVTVTALPVGEFGPGTLEYRFADGASLVKPWASLLLPWHR